MNNTNNYMITFLGFISQIRTFHWQTENYAEHMALGSLYDGISDLSDTFMETYIGVYGRSETTEEAANMLSFDCSKLMATINDFQTFLMNIELSNTDLLNIRDEMLGLTNKTKYLLTLE